MKQVFNSADEAYGAIESGLMERIDADPELAADLGSLPDEELELMLNSYREAQIAEMEIDTGRQAAVGGGMTGPKMGPVRRKLYDPATERKWQQIKAGELDFDAVAPESQVAFEELAKAENFKLDREQGFFEKRLKTMGARAGEFMPGALSGVVDMMQRGAESLAQSGVSMAGVNLGGGAPRGVRVGTNEKIDVPLEPVVNTLRDIKRLSAEAYDADPEYAQSFEGQLLGGGINLMGQLATVAATGGASIIPIAGQLYSEAIEDAEAMQGVKYEDMDEPMRKAVDQTAALYSMIATGLELGPLKVISSGIFDGAKKLGVKEAVKRLSKPSVKKEIAKAFLAEGGTEAVQGQLLGELAKRIQKDGRDTVNPEQLKQRLTEFLVGGILGGSLRGSLVGGAKLAQGVDGLNQQFNDAEAAVAATDIGQDAMALNAFNTTLEQGEAPIVRIGNQVVPGQGPMKLYNTTVPLGKYPVGTTVTEQSLRELGISEERLASVTRPVVEQGSSPAVASAATAEARSPVVPVQPSVEKPVSPAPEPSLKTGEENATLVKPAGERIPVAKDVVNIPEISQESGAKIAENAELRTLADQRNAEMDVAPSNVSAGGGFADAAAMGAQSFSGEVQAALEGARMQRPIGETTFERYALQLNEMGELAAALGKGKYPKIAEAIAGIPNARGVFKPSAAGGEVQLRADTFELLTEAEILEINDLAEQMGYEAYLDQLEATGAAGMTPPTMEQYVERVQRDPLLKRQQDEITKEMLIEARREVAPVREPMQALQTLAHEIGHWVDFVPDQDMSRGNVLGRIAGVHKYFKRMLPGAPGEGPVISQRERSKLRYKAQKMAGGDADKTAVIYNNMLNIERKARGLITEESVRSELEALTVWWRLKGDASKLTDYHKSSVELYADAFSVLINAPEELAARAPVFYRAFENYFSNKPAARDAYEDLQKAIADGTSQSKQAERLRESLSRDDALLSERDQPVTSAELWDGFTQAMGREFQPFYRRAKRQGRDLYKRSKHIVTNYLYRATQHELYLSRLNQEVLKPLAEVGKDMTQFDEFLFHKHVLENRFNIANPLGWTGKTSTEQLANLEAADPVGYAAMEAAQDAWFKMRKRMMIDPLRESGVFNEELMDAIEERVFYTPFRKNEMRSGVKEGSFDELLAKNFGKDMGVRIARQIGQLGEVKSPANSLMGVDLRLMDYVKRNAAKAEVVRVLQATDPDNIRKAETRRVKKGRAWVEEPIDVNNDRVGTLYVVRDGKPTGYYVPKAITVPFDKQMNINSAWYTRALYQANTFQKSLFTQINPGFWPVAMVRDVMTRYRKMPSAPGDLLRDFAAVGVTKDAARILAAFPQAWRSVKGDIDAELQGMMERGELISRRETMGHGNTYAGADIDRALIEFDKDPKNYFTKRSGAEKKVSGALRFWLSIGQAFERAPKIATRRYLDENFPEWTEVEKTNFVREHGGSPDFMQRGSWAPYVDLLALFWNPAREGWMSEGDAALNDPKGYALRTAQTVLPSLAFKLAGLGLMGAGGLKVLSMMMPWIRDEEELQEMMQSVSHYDMMNYDVIPLAWADKQNKKVLYARLPKDEGSRIAMGMIMQPVLESGEISSVLNYTDGTLPGMNPVLGVLLDWRAYGMNGQNPYDSFLQRNIIDSTKFKADEGMEDMLYSSWNKLGGSIVKRVETNRPSLVEDTRMEKMLDLPVVQNVIGRWFKISNAGASQRIQKAGIVKDAGRKAAQSTLIARDIVEKIVAQDSLSSKEKEMMMDPAVQQKVYRYMNDVGKRAMGPEMQAIESLQTQEEKLAALQLIFED